MYHIVWVPKYRKPILVGRVKNKLEGLLRQCAEHNGWEIQELNVQPEHVHMMIQLPPSVSVSRAVQLFKGKSSKMIRDEELPEVRKFLWGSNFWAEGYFCATVGSVDEQIIRDYVKNQ